MVKNTATRRLFRKKCGETGPQAGTKNGEKAQRSGFFVSLGPAARRGFFDRSAALTRDGARDTMGPTGSKEMSA